MYAIVEIAGKQYKVHENDKLVVPRLSGDVDDTVTFDRVLLVANGDDDIQLGTPVVDGATVTATIVEHVKGDKVLVFRKKRRKRFKVKRGHRQPYTRITVGELSVNGGAKEEKKSKPAAKKETKSKADDKAAKAAAKADEAAKAEEADATVKADESAAAKKAEGTAPKATTEKAEDAPKAKKAAKSKQEDSDEAEE